MADLVRFRPFELFNPEVLPRETPSYGDVIPESKPSFRVANPEAFPQTPTQPTGAERLARAGARLDAAAPQTPPAAPTAGGFRSSISVGGALSRAVGILPEAIAAQRKGESFVKAPPVTFQASHAVPGGGIEDYAAKPSFAATLRQTSPALTLTQTNIEAPSLVQRPVGGWPGEDTLQTVPANPGELRSMAVDYGRGITELVGTPVQRGRSFTNLIPAGAPSAAINEAVNRFRTGPQGVLGGTETSPATPSVSTPDDFRAQYRTEMAARRNTDGDPGRIGKTLGVESEADYVKRRSAEQATALNKDQFRPAMQGKTVNATNYARVYGSIPEQRKAYDEANAPPDRMKQIALEKAMIELENLKKAPAKETKLNSFGIKQKTDNFGGGIAGLNTVDFGEYGTYDVSTDDAAKLQSYQQQLFQDFLAQGENTRDAYNNAVTEAYKIFSTPRAK